MSQRSVLALAIVLTTSACPIACALTSKADLVGVRYFSPERGSALDARRRQRRASLALTEVRIGRVTSGANLRERIAHRDSTYECGYYDEYRWTERPEAYVRRELARSLFEVQGLKHSMDSTVPTLDIELIAFDDLRVEAGRAARVELRYVLYEVRIVLSEGTITYDQPVSKQPPGIEGFVSAMSAALETAVARVGTIVGEALAMRHAAPAIESRP